MRIGFTRAAWITAGLIALAAAAFSQRFGGGGFGGFGGRSDAPDSVFPANAEFHFLRVEYSDYPTVRAIDREASQDNYKFSALILAVVNSTPFQMRRVSES